MRPGETVLVCGAAADMAQFDAFVWPAWSVVWVSVGCGHVESVSCLPPGPSDATEAAREELARAYIRAVNDPPSDVERAVWGLCTWLALVERASRVPAVLVVACGAVRVTAVPIFRVTWSRRAVTVAGHRFRTAVPRAGFDSVEDAAHVVLSKRGILPGPTVAATCVSPSLASAYKIVWSGARMIHLHPHERCAFCDARVDSRVRKFISARPERAERQAAFPERSMWLPTLSACVSCAPHDRATSVGIWRAFFFCIESVGDQYPSMSVRVRADEPETYTALFGEGCEESAWQANDRVVEALALALWRGARPNEGTFAASLAGVLCDLKLLRIVAACMPRPRPGAAEARAVTILLGVPCKVVPSGG
jgi:hypothetical protein